MTKSSLTFFKGRKMAKKKKKAAKKTATKKAAKKSNKGTKAQSGTPAKETTPVETDSTEVPPEKTDDVKDPGKGTPTDANARIAKLEKENSILKAKISNRGIPTKKMPEKNKKLLRNGARLELGFEHAMQKKDHKTCTVQELQAVEYQIRKYVKKGGTRMDGKKQVTIKGGYRKNLKPEDQERAEGLLEFMGRDTKNPTWDLNIEVLGMETM